MRSIQKDVKEKWSQTRQLSLPFQKTTTDYMINYMFKIKTDSIPEITTFITMKFSDFAVQLQNVV